LIPDRGKVGVPPAAQGGILLLPRVQSFKPREATGGKRWIIAKSRLLALDIPTVALGFDVNVVAISNFQYGCKLAIPIPSHYCGQAWKQSI